MKLGEALTLRARQAQKLNDLQGRIKAAAMVQEGDEPQEDCNELMNQYVELSGEHLDLNVRIARTNAQTNPSGVKTLLALIQEREHRIRHRNILRLTCSAATPGSSQYRYMRSEVKLVPQINVAELREEEATIEKEINSLDTEIQKINWATDLI